MFFLTEIRFYHFLSLFDLADWRLFIQGIVWVFNENQILEPRRKNLQFLEREICFFILDHGGNAFSFRGKIISIRGK